MSDDEHSEMYWPEDCPPADWAPATVELVERMRAETLAELAEFCDFDRLSAALGRPLMPVEKETVERVRAQVLAVIDRGHASAMRRLGALQ